MIRQARTAPRGSRRQADRQRLSCAHLARRHIGGIEPAAAAGVAKIRSHNPGMLCPRRIMMLSKR